MPQTIKEVSRITAKGQTTVPKVVRQVLGVEPGDHIAFRIEEGRVIVERATEDHEDPFLGPFLSLLAKDVNDKPERLVALTPALVNRISELTKGIEVDPNTPIEGDVDL